MKQVSNRMTYKPSDLRSMSRDEILCLLEERLDCMTDLTYDEKEIDALLAELNEQDPLPKVNVERSLSSFHAQHDIPFVSSPVPEKEPQTESKRNIHFSSIARRTLATAAALTILCTAAAQALGADPVGTLIRWTASVLDPNMPRAEVPAFQDPTAEGPTVEVPTPEQVKRYPYRYQTYNSLTEHLNLCGIYAQLEIAPETEGFSFVYAAEESSTTCITISALYSDGKRELTEIIRHYLTEEIPTPDAPEGLVLVFDDVEHHILSNEDGTLTAWWVNGSDLCSLSGNVTVAEMQSLLISLYTTPVDSPWN